MFLPTQLSGGSPPGETLVDYCSVNYCVPVLRTSPKAFCGCRGGCVFCGAVLVVVVVVDLVLVVVVVNMVVVVVVV